MKSMIANRSMTYGTRRLKAEDPFQAVLRDANLLNRLGRARYAASHPLDHDKDGKKGGSQKPPQNDALVALRKEYEDAVGKRPFNGWSAKELRKRIDEAKAD